MMTLEQKDRAKTTRMMKKYVSQMSWILKLYCHSMVFITDEEYIAEYGYEPKASDKVEKYLFDAETPDGTAEFSNCFDYARGLNLPERVWEDESESIPMIADIVARIGSRLTEEQPEKVQAMQDEFFAERENHRIKALEAEQKQREQEKKIAEYNARKTAEFQQILEDVKAGKKLRYRFYLREQLEQIAEAGNVEVPANVGIAELIQKIIDAGIMEARASQGKTPAEKAKECGKAIVSLKGNAKAQQGKLGEYGEDFMYDMLLVFSTPQSAKTLADKRKYLCRDVLKCARDREYAEMLREMAVRTINNLEYHLSWYEGSEREESELSIQHVKGWCEFLDKILDEKPVEKEEIEAKREKSMRPIMARIFLSEGVTSTRNYELTEMLDQYAENRGTVQAIRDE